MVYPSEPLTTNALPGLGRQTGGGEEAALQLARAEPQCGCDRSHRTSRVHGLGGSSDDGIR
jgi:hypothetical protein